MRFEKWGDAMFNDKNFWKFMLPVTILSLIGSFAVVVIIPATSALITVWIDSVAQVIQNWFRRISIPGESRIEGLVQLCLYLVFIVVAVKLITKK